MKIGTTEKLKFKNLQRRLSLPMWQAVGLLESLWKATYRNAPAGDIGRLSNDEIAAAIEWAGNADELVDALVQTRWFDPDPTHRLLVHHWEQECEAWLRANFERHHKSFAQSTQNGAHDLTKQCVSQPTEEVTKQPTCKPSIPYPSIPYPPPPPHNAKWEGVEEDLLKYGVVKAADVCRTAEAAGCTVTQVLNAMEFWRSRQPAWGPGALYERLMRLKPDQTFDSLWPQPAVSDGYRQVSAAEFTEFAKMKKFKSRPGCNATNPNWVYGTLRDGSKVECKEYRKQ